MRHFIGSSLLLWLLSLSYLGCEDQGVSPLAPPGGNNNGGGVSFAASIRPLVQTRCATASCHGAGSSQGGLALGSVAYTDVRNAKGGRGGSLVSTPPKADSSLLYTVATSNPPIGYTRMPLGGPYLSNAELTLIRDWINQGAFDN
ncbi:MAG: hypothetical protein SGI97_08730 [candidate division Zixibacteria bacterium]|nr:hypothetical protein [candidate division Zixibacteria bacterium]